MGATAFELLISVVPIENKIEIRDEREKDTDNFPKEPRGLIVSSDSNSNSSDMIHLH